MFSSEPLREFCIDESAKLELLDDYLNFEYILEKFVQSNPNAWSDFALALGYVVYYRGKLNTAARLENLVNRFFVAGEDSDFARDQMYNATVANIESIEKAFKVDENGEFALTFLHALSAIKLLNSARPAALALLSLPGAFSQMSEQVARDELYKYQGSYYQKLNVLDSSRREHFTLRVILCNVVLGEDDSISLNLPCQGGKCKQFNGAVHSATRVIYCPHCWGAELICERMMEEMVYNSVAPTVHFSKTCNDMVLDYRHCSIAPIEHEFGY